MLICFYGIIAKCFEPLEHPISYSDSICYDMVFGCGAASSQLLGRVLGQKRVGRGKCGDPVVRRSAKMNIWYHSQVF